MSEAPRYELRQSIGRGGMGEVFLAFDRRLQRNVAIKVLAGRAEGSTDSQRRLREEALALSKLAHPNIATIHDLDVQDGTDILVMEYVPGKNLSEMIETETWTLDRFLDHALQMCDAIDSAHRVGIVHRDLKPGNIRVTPEERVKILDFGIARLLEVRTQITQEAPTETMGLHGTPAYLSPEVLQGARASAGSDQFALGLVFYQMLTGKHPFWSNSAAGVEARIAHDEPIAPRRLRMGLAPPLEHIILRMLRKAPSERFGSLAEVAAALRNVERNAPQSPARRHWLRLATMGVGVVAAVLAGVYVATPGEIWSTPQSTGVIRQLTFSGRAGVPIWSPDGRHIAYTNTDGVHVMSATGGTARKLNLTSKYSVGWGWTPDSRAIILHGTNPETGRHHVFTIDPVSEEQRSLTEGVFGSISPDGKQLVFARMKERDICVLDLVTGERRNLVSPPRPGDAVYKPKWSPNGDWVAYNRWSGDLPQHELWVVRRDGRDNRRVSPSALGLGGNYAWTPDGKHVFDGGELNGVWYIWKVSIDGKKFVRMTPGSELEHHVSLNPDGSKFAYMKTHETTRILLLDTKTGREQVPFEVTAPVHGPSMSADGKAMLFTMLIQGRWELWRRDLSSASQQNSVSNVAGVSCMNPVPGIDGSVVYMRASSGRTNRFGDVRWSQTIWRYTDGGHHVSLGGLSPVSRLAASGERNGSLLLAKHSGDGEVLHTRSPDGTMKAFFEDDEGESFSAFDWGPGNDEVVLALLPAGEQGSRLAILNPESGSKRTLFEWENLARDTLAKQPGAARFLSTSPDRSQVAFALRTAEPRGWEIHVLDFATGDARQVYRSEGPDNIESLSWTHGHALVFGLVHTDSDIFLWEPEPS